MNRISSGLIMTLDRRRLLLITVVAIAAAALLIPGCGREKARVSEAAAPRAKATDYAAGGETAKNASGAQTDTEALPTPSKQSEQGTDTTDASGRKLIRTGSMSIEVDNAEKKIAEIEKIAKNAGGFVGDTSLTRYDDGSLHASVQVRVPTDKFDTALQKLKKLGKVNNQSTDVQDVTEQFVDLQARIRNKKRQEERLLKLLDRSGKLADVLKIEKALSDVRQTIERHQGQMRVLKEQINLSTIDVTLTEKGEAAVAEAGKYDIRYHLKSAVRGLTVLIRGILTFLIWLIIVGWVIWLPIIIIVWYVRRRRRQGKQQQAPPPNTEQ